MLACPNRSLMTLMYWREYRTLFHIANNYGVHESTAQRIITRVEDSLIQLGQFSLPKKRQLATDSELVVVLIDRAETPIERPQKKQAHHYGGKKKRHTLKTQVVVDIESLRILSVAQAREFKADLRLFRTSRGQFPTEV